jgi:hypothetical protein
MANENIRVKLPEWFIVLRDAYLKSSKKINSDKTKKDYNKASDYPTDLIKYDSH